MEDIRKRLNGINKTTLREDVEIALLNILDSSGMDYESFEIDLSKVKIDCDVFNYIVDVAEKAVLKNESDYSLSDEKIVYATLRQALGSVIKPIMENDPEEDLNDNEILEMLYNVDSGDLYDKISNKLNNTSVYSILENAVWL